MCGIAGIVSLKGLFIQEAQIQRMVTLLHHRGPDGRGVYIDRNIALGHTRLAITDLTEAGMQPMRSADGRYTITFNGEIYNFKNLREALIIKGYQFKSESDTEVLLNLYAEKKEYILDELNGMFAFAIWDSVERELFLARDRYGIKPLYYAIIDNQLVFASEIKAITHIQEYRKAPDEEGILEYFTFQNFFTEKTLYKGIRTFPAGYFLKYEEKKYNNIKFSRYWDFSFHEPADKKTEEIYIDELIDLFQQAVEDQIPDKVELGAYLSGGIDSGSITAFASRLNPMIKTFTCGFDLNSISGLEVNFDERSTAEYMSYLFKTEHYEVVLKAGDMERSLPQVAWHIEEPRVGQSYPNYFVSRLASKFVKVVLSGSGGDELFGGYPWRYYQAVVSDSFDDFVEKYYSFWQRLVPQNAMADFFSPLYRTYDHFDPKGIFKFIFRYKEKQNLKPEDYFNYSLYFEAKTFLHGLLIVEDKLSMAHGLEARLPFLDNRIVDYSMKLPAALKMTNLTRSERIDENEPGKKGMHYDRTGDGKKILRDSLLKYIPQEVLAKKKQGFSAPDASWFRGESINFVKKRILNNQAKLYNFLNRKVVQTLVNEHLEGKQNRRLLIWSLLNFEEWIEQNL
jgi:asparagine synthase (glutamine-hydrolysing)